jgi:hypothetical protein
MYNRKFSNIYISTHDLSRKIVQGMQTTVRTLGPSSKQFTVL